MLLVLSFYFSQTYLNTLKLTANKIYFICLTTIVSLLWEIGAKYFSCKQNLHILIYPVFCGRFIWCSRCYQYNNTYVLDIGLYDAAGLLLWRSPQRYFFFKREASEAAWCLLVGGHKYLCINSNYRLGPAQAWGWEGIDTSYKYKWSWKDTGVLSGRPPIYVFLIYFFPSDSTQSVRLLQTKANRLQNTEYLLVASTRESQDRYSCLLYSKKIETGFASQCFYSIRGLC